MARSNRPKIVVQSLVKNEDLYVRDVLTNVIDFCDEMILLDNMSTDDTYPALQEFKAEHGDKVQLHQIENFRDSGNYNRKYMRTNTWILSVDGDEIYDPVGLEQVRKDLKDNKYSDKWVVSGYFLNCTELDYDNEVAKGYMSPPSRPCVRLYNFRVCRRWRQRKHRMHGGKPLLKKGYDFMKSRFTMHEHMSWEECPLRFLHLCFISRSSKITNECRKNPTELYNKSKGIKAHYRGGYKKQNYQVGEIETVDIKPFFPEEF
jgi:glycosyltransferase involved in cell wall biosynthesis